MTKPAKIVVWVLVMTFLAATWTYVFDKVWPHEADAKPVCSASNQGSYPKASRGKRQQWVDGELGRTKAKHVRTMALGQVEAKAKKAYKRYTENHPCGPQGCGGLPEKSAGTYEGPSPPEWWAQTKQNVKCATVGVS